VAPLWVPPLLADPDELKRLTDYFEKGPTQWADKLAARLQELQAEAD
jgi:hypothetical protein